MNKVICFTDNMFRNKQTFKLAKAWETTNAFFIKSDHELADEWNRIALEIFKYIIRIDTGELLNAWTNEQIDKKSTEFISQIKSMLDKIGIDDYLLINARHICDEALCKLK